MSAVPGMHAFSGCDTTSCFRGKGKRATFHLTQQLDSVRLAMSGLGNSLPCRGNVMERCEASVCHLYKVPMCTSINLARYQLFSKKSPKAKQLSLTMDALNQHTRRSNYQAYIWKHALQTTLNMPSPDGNGWVVKETAQGHSYLEITWMTLAPAPQALLKFVSCKCRTGCNTGRCSCFDCGLGCTDVCGCCNCKNKCLEESNTLESEEANSTSAKLDDTALPSDFDEDDSDSKFRV